MFFSSTVLILCIVVFPNKHTNKQTIKKRKGSLVVILGGRETKNEISKAAAAGVLIYLSLCNKQSCVFFYDFEDIYLFGEKG